MGLLWRWTMIPSFKLQRFINQLMVGLSWNYTRCLSSSSMVHLIVAWLLLLSHWKYSWEAIYVEDVSFKQNKMHVKSQIDCLNKEIMSPLQRHFPITSVCHFILLWFRWLRSTVDEVFVERVRNKSTGEKMQDPAGFKPNTFWILVRHSYH